MRRKLWKEDKQEEAVKRRMLNIFSHRVLTRFEFKVLTACWDKAPGADAVRERACALKWRESETVVDVLMRACQSLDRWTGSAPGHSQSEAAIITQVGGELQMIERRAASKSMLIFNESGRERKPGQRCKFREENVKDRSRAATTYYFHNLLF